MGWLLDYEIQVKKIGTLVPIFLTSEAEEIGDLMGDFSKLDQDLSVRWKNKRLEKE